MTKALTKVMAGLGIVAGLGVAALPLSSYAAADIDDILVKVTVNSMFTVSASGNIELTNATATSSPDGITTVTVTDNDGGTHAIYMGILEASASAGLIGTVGNAIGTTIPASATAVANGTAGWQYGYSVGTAVDFDALTTKTQPVQYTDTGNTTGGTPIAATGSVSSGTATYTIGAKAGVSTTTPDGTYQNTIRVYATENP